VATLQNLPDATTFLPASGASTSPVAIRSVLYAVFKHRRLVLGILAVVFLGSALAAFLRPRTWLASSKVLVKLGETVQLAPAEAPSRSVNLPLNQDVVKTEADIIKSQVVIAEVVRRLGIQPEPGTDMDELLQAMQLATTVTQNPGGNILQINFLGRDPNRAARNANAITDVYIEHHNKVYGKSGMSDFYNEQLQALDGQMNDAERRLKQFLAKHDIVDAETQIKLLAADEIEQEKGLQAHLAKISALRKKAETVRAQLAKTPEQIAWGQEYTTNPTMLTYKNRLADLQLSRASVAQRYLATDRHVQDFDNQIADVKARMRGEEEKLLSKQTMRTSLLNMDLKRGVFSMEALLADAEARKPDLWRRLKTTQKRLKTLRQLSFQVANLQEEADRKKYAYQLYWKKHEEARATEAMSSQSMVSVSVVDRAVPPIDPQNPPWIPLALGLFAGLVLGAATAVAVEFLNRRLRFEQEVEHYLELPVLAVIPDLDHVPNFARG
jgi:polysaccharide biosynthesis transport protein